MKKLILFDMDGVVIDSMPALRQLAISIISKAFKLSEDDAARGYDDTVGHPFKEQLDMLYPELDREFVGRNLKLADRYQEAHKLLCSYFNVAPDFERFLRWLKFRRCKTALISSTNAIVIQTCLQQVLILPFDFILGRVPLQYFPFEADKSQQAGLLMASQSIPPEEVLYLGDSRQDEIYASFLGVTFRHTIYTDFSMPTFTITIARLLER